MPLSEWVSRSEFYLQFGILLVPLEVVNGVGVGQDSLLGCGVPLGLAVALDGA